MPNLTTELIPINIGNINDGAMIEGFDIELRKVLANITDLNTAATASRSITLKLILKPQSDRMTIETEFKCQSSLSPIETHRAKCLIGRSEDGLPVAFSNDPRQMTFWTAPKPKVTEPLEFKTSV